MLFCKFVLIFLLISKFKISLAKEKNACKHLSEYPVINFVPGTDCFYNPNVNSNMYKMVANNGYDLRAYNVTTPKGYILTIFRVSLRNSSENSGQPVFIQHGLLTDSSIWVMTGKRSMAFSLVEQGYDVWLGNLRTSIYAKTNINFSSKSKRYWDFSLDELASDDLASILKKVADVTDKAGEIIYIGHSMGTTLVFMYASAFAKEAHGLLKGIVTLCPVVYLEPNFAIGILLKIGPIFVKLCRFLKIYVLLYDIMPIRQVVQFFTKYFPYLLSALPMYLFSGTNKLFLPEDMLAYQSYYPDTINVNTLNQYIQMYCTNKFQKYDHGSLKNQQLYGQKEPPLYDLSIISMPVYMFYGVKDAYIKTKKVERIYSEIGSTEKDMQTVPIGRDETDLQFGHVDFEVARDVDALFYPDLYRYLKKLQ